jgi:hypothetical protein
MRHPFVNDGGRLSVRCWGKVTSFDDVPADSGTKIGITKMSRNVRVFAPSHSFPLRKLFYKFVEVVEELAILATIPVLSRPCEGPQ